MASQVNPNTIDITYPVAGQDNNSQGFRDNFTNIQTNLQVVKDELEDLQSKVVLKSALNGTTLDNDFNGNVMINPAVSGNLYIRGAEVKTNYEYETFNADGLLTITSGKLAAGTQTFYIDNTSSSGTLLSNIGIVLPEPSATMANGVVICISGLCPVTSVAWNTSGGNSAKIKGVTSTSFQTLGASVKLHLINPGSLGYIWAKTS